MSAILETLITSSKSQSGLEYAIFSLNVLLKRKVCCETNPILERRLFKFKVFNGISLINICPSKTS